MLTVGATTSDLASGIVYSQRSLSFVTANATGTECQSSSHRVPALLEIDGSFSLGERPSGADASRESVRKECHDLTNSSQFDRHAHDHLMKLLLRWPRLHELIEFQDRRLF